MPLGNRMVGESTRTLTHDVDARWMMAYAAGLQDNNPRYMDTSTGEILAHPLFPVCLEWPVILTSRELPGYESVSSEESARGVHATHDLHLYKPIVAGETYSTKATVISLQTIKPGAAQTTRLDTTDSSGDLVCSTWQLGISRGVAVDGEDAESEPLPAPPDAAGAKPADKTFYIEVPAGAANIYTETARIFNPIHSDKAFALAAGLPDIILHGTATLALAVTTLVDNLLGADPSGITRIGGRFTGMVLMPETLKVVVSL